MLPLTIADFKNPAFSPADLLVSIGSTQQFDNPELAKELAARWGLLGPAKSATNARTGPRAR
jgi:hypothetical protein